LKVTNTIKLASKIINKYQKVKIVSELTKLNNKKNIGYHALFFVLYETIFITNQFQAFHLLCWCVWEKCTKFLFT
jgi:hypothetical protein